MGFNATQAIVLLCFLMRVTCSLGNRSSKGSKNRLLSAFYVSGTGLYMDMFVYEDSISCPVVAYVQWSGEMVENESK